MKIIYKLFKQNPEKREDIIVVTSGLGIAVNVLIATVKIIIGILVSSVAIISEGVNNASDALTSILALVGAKLAGKHPDEKHPFGYGRIEYLASLTISILILITGTEMMINAVKCIFNPTDLSVSYISLIIVAVTAVIKFVLGIYTMKMGEKADSNSLIGVGADCRNDSFASMITIVASLIFIVSGFSIDAYAGVIISLLILKAGYDVLKDTISDLLGRPGDEELAANLYKLIRSTPGIESAVDMMLHNYGPDAWTGSVNVEIQHDKTVGEVYQFLHALQLKIMYEYKVVMIFGIYAVDNKTEDTKILRTNIYNFIRTNEHIQSYHAVYVDKEEKMIYCDFIVDYKLRDWDSVQVEFKEYMAKLYPEFQVTLTIETQFV